MPVRTHSMSADRTMPAVEVDMAYKKMLKYVIIVKNFLDGFQIGAGFRFTGMDH